MHLVTCSKRAYGAAASLSRGLVADGASAMSAERDELHALDARVERAVRAGLFGRPGTARWMAGRGITGMASRRSRNSRMQTREAYIVVPAGMLAIIVPGAVYRVEHRLLPSLDAELEKMDTWRPPTTCRVFDRNGEKIDEFALVRRFWVDIDELPASRAVLVAAEDRRFFAHNGGLGRHHSGCLGQPAG